MDNTIRSAIETPVVNDLILAVGKPSVSRLIEFELAKLAAAVSVGGNLDNYKVQLIATQLVEFFPNESIGDFKVCFFRASAGQYGDIFRLDGIVVRKFMEKYLEEKSEYRENQNNKRKKEEPKSLPSPPKEGGEGYEMFKKWAADLQKIASKPMYTNDDLMKFKDQASTERAEYLRKTIMGSHSDKPPTGAQPMTQSEIEEWHRQKAKSLEEAKARRIAELREKHPTLTQEELNRLL